MVLKFILTGIGTSSAYCDPSLRNHGFPFECQRRSNRTIVVKSHRHGQNAFIIRFESVILLIRNPFNAILSYFHYSNREHIGHADDSKFFTKGRHIQCKKISVNITVKKKLATIDVDI